MPREYQIPLELEEGKNWDCKICFIIFPRYHLLTAHVNSEHAEQVGPVLLLHFLDSAVLNSLFSGTFRFQGM
jgi:hypothetical protein